jgi:hypothetical protein
MLIYSHSTPEILTNTIRDVDDVKNSEYCGLIGPDFPEDVMALEGDDLVIPDEPDKLNKEIAVAIAFNSVRDCESAKQFVRLFLLNGATMDTATVLYYKDRIASGPFADCAQEYSRLAFEAASFGLPSHGGVKVETGGGSFGKSSKDRRFLKTLLKALSDCLNAPCDYMKASSAYGFLEGDSPIGDGGEDSPPVIDDLLTFNKIPEAFQQAATTLSIIGHSTYQSMKHVFSSKEERKAAQDAVKQKFDKSTTKPPPKKEGEKRRSIGTSLAKLIPTNIVEGVKKLIAASKIKTAMIANLGDCFRQNEYQKNHNPYTYVKSGGTNGEGVGPRSAMGVVEATIQRGKGPPTTGKSSNIDYTPPPGLNGFGGVGIATVFGLNLNGSTDTQDLNGVGAFGANLRDPKLVGVSIPFGTAVRWFGKNYRQIIRETKPLVEVTLKDKTIRAPIVDLGPAAWTKNDLDLTYRTAKKLGSTGKDTVTYKLVSPPK